MRILYRDQGNGAAVRDDGHVQRGGGTQVRRTIVGVMVVALVSGCATQDAATSAAASGEVIAAEAAEGEETRGGMTRDQKIAAGIAGGVLAGALLYFIILGIGAAALMDGMSGPR
jgi:hypothetical protein